MNPVFDEDFYDPTVIDAGDGRPGVKGVTPSSMALPAPRVRQD